MKKIFPEVSIRNQELCKTLSFFGSNISIPLSEKVLEIPFFPLKISKCSTFLPVKKGGGLYNRIILQDLGLGKLERNPPPLSCYSRNYPDYSYSYAY